LAEVCTLEGYILTSLNYVICDDAYLLEINNNFLQHDTFTDIITFDLSTKTNLIEGEIYVSWERVRENAPLFHTSVQKEFRRVLLHGLLHLCGHGDGSKKEKEAMRASEDLYLASFPKK